MPTQLLLFVYGALKRGGEYFASHCADATFLGTATVLGRLYKQPANYPALIVPQQTIHAVGTSHYADDLATQLEQRTRTTSEPPPANQPTWGLVHGELLGFTDLAALGPLDELEQFYPGQDSLYQRVLAPVRCSAQEILAWMYIMDEHAPGLVPIPSGHWKPGG